MASTKDWFETVAEALEVAEDKGVEDLLPFATSALREAPNGEDVLSRVRRETAVDLQVLTGAESVLRASGYDVLVYNLPDQVAREQFFDELPLRRRVDAVMVVSLTPTAAEEEALARLGLPVTVVGESNCQPCSMPASPRKRSTE